MDGVAPFLGPGGHLVKVLLRDDFWKGAVTGCVVHGLMNVAGNDGSFTTDLAVLAGGPVAGDARHPLARDPASLPQRHFPGLTHLGANLGVAAHAESAHRPRGQIVDGLLEFMEHGRDGRVGVIRRGPFVVDLFVATGALRGAGIGLRGEDVEMGIFLCPGLHGNRRRRNENRNERPAHGSPCPAPDMGPTHAKGEGRFHPTSCAP